MRPPTASTAPYQAPIFLAEAKDLNRQLQQLTKTQFQTHMQLSPDKAEQTMDLTTSWSLDPLVSRPAVDAFLGDIYSGLQVQTFTPADRSYTNDHLLILSGLYGGLRALDSIQPYRLEMGYKLPLKEYKNLYEFWDDKVARLIPPGSTVVNLSAVEYTKAVLPHITNPVVSPKFLTVSPKTGQPTFVTVHAKIARGAFAHWLIKNKVDSVNLLPTFNQLGYTYDASASTPEQPVFVCQTFKGLGLSVRLT